MQSDFDRSKNTEMVLAANGGRGRGQTPVAAAANPTPTPEASSEFFSLIRSFVKRASFWVVVYSLGATKCHVAWLLVPLSIGAIIKYRKAKTKKRPPPVKVRDLPPWVYFPDTDRVEWINKMLRQLWPRIQEYADKTAEDMTKKNGALEGYKFYATHLGEVCPQLGGVKVYGQHPWRRGEILLDVECVWASNCHLGINLAGAAVTASVSDIYVSGTMRIALKPLLRDYPLVGGLSVAFIAPPRLDFDLGGIANLVDMPGLAGVVRRLIVEQIASFAVLPKSVFIPLAEQELLDEARALLGRGKSVSGESAPSFQEWNLLRVTVVEGKDLEAKDRSLLGKATSDPYVTVSFSTDGGRTPPTQAKSSVCKKTLSPRWELSCEAVAPQDEDEEEDRVAAVVEVWDWDKGSGDDFMGRVPLTLLELRQLGKVGNAGRWMELRNAKRGKLRLRGECLAMREDVVAESVEAGEEEGRCAVVLNVYLESCRDLPDSKKGRAPSPRVHLWVSGREGVFSVVVPFSREPVFGQQFALPVSNLASDGLYVRVTDERSSPSSTLGEACVHLSDLLARPDSMRMRQPLALKAKSGSGSSGCVVLAARIIFPDSGRESDHI